jgi:acyl-CoA thioesterase-1
LRGDLDPEIQIVRQLALEFDAIYIPFDGLFAAASSKREPAFWAADGVHPTSVGHAFMAIEWLKAMGID